MNHITLYIPVVPSDIRQLYRFLSQSGFGRRILSRLGWSARSSCCFLPGAT